MVAPLSSNSTPRADQAARHRPRPLPPVPFLTPDPLWPSSLVGPAMQCSISDGGSLGLPVSQPGSFSSPMVLSLGREGGGSEVRSLVGRQPVFFFHPVSATSNFFGLYGFAGPVGVRSSTEIRHFARRKMDPGGR